MKEIQFPEIIEKLSKEKGINKSDLARYLGLTRQSISLYCSGKITPELSTLIKIAEYFEVSLDYLITGDKPEHNQEREELGLSEKALELLSQNARAKKGEEFNNISRHINKFLSDKEFYLCLQDCEKVNSEKLKDCQNLEKINEGGKYDSLIKNILEQTIRDSGSHMGNYFRLFYQDLLSHIKEQSQTLL